MKNIILLSLLLLLVPFLAKAEDVIHYTNGEKLSAKVIEVGKDYVKYRKSTNLDGPVYSESTELISRIDYENGTNDVWNHEPEIFDFNNSKFDLQFGVSASIFTTFPQLDVNFGYMPNRHFRVGLGLGITIKDFSHEDVKLVPVFLNLKYIVLKTKFSPYIKLDYGYFIITDEAKKYEIDQYARFSIGVDWKRKHGYFSLELGAESNGIYENRDYYLDFDDNNTGSYIGFGYTYCF